MLWFLGLQRVGHDRATELNRADDIFKKYLFIYFWLCWVLLPALGLSLVAASRA